MFPQEKLGLVWSKYENRGRETIGSETIGSDYGYGFESGGWISGCGI
jgi:hypothetical protein